MVIGDDGDNIVMMMVMTIVIVITMMMIAKQNKLLLQDTYLRMESKHCFLNLIYEGLLCGSGFCYKTLLQDILFTKDLHEAQSFGAKRFCKADPFENGITVIFTGELMLSI